MENPIFGNTQIMIEVTITSRLNLSSKVRYLSVLLGEFSSDNGSFTCHLKQQATMATMATRGPKKTGETACMSRGVAARS